MATGYGYEYEEMCWLSMLALADVVSSGPAMKGNMYELDGVAAPCILAFAIVAI
jgi:hypothetical protein